MAAVADLTYGYGGEINQSVWSRMAAQFGADFSFEDETSLTITKSTADRGITVSPGSAYGHGVRDEWQTQADLSAGQLSAGTRWDTVVIRRDWVAHRSQLMIVPGTSAAVVAAGIENTPGTRADHPIGLIQVTAGLTGITGIVPLRQYPSKVVHVSDERAYPLEIAPVGARIRGPQGYELECRMVNGKKSWVASTPRFWRGKVWDGTAGINFSANQVVSPPIYPATDRFADSINMDPMPYIINPGKNIHLPAPGGYRFTWQAEWQARPMDGAICAVRIYKNHKESNTWFAEGGFDESREDADWSYVSDGIAALDSRMAARGARARCEVYLQMAATDTVMMTTFHTATGLQQMLRFGENATYCTIERVN